MWQETEGYAHSRQQCAKLQFLPLDTDIHLRRAEGDEIWWEHAKSVTGLLKLIQLAIWSGIQSALLASPRPCSTRRRAVVGIGAGNLLRDAGGHMAGDECLRVSAPRRRSAFPRQAGTSNSSCSRRCQAPGTPTLRNILSLLRASRRAMSRGAR